MSIHMFLKCIMNLFGAMLIISIVTKPTNCDTCPNDTFSNFKVGNLSKCYWLFTSQKEGIGWNRYRNSTVIMGFCHGLQTSMGCGSTSSICVQTYNGTGANETKNYSVGKLIPNKNPYSAIKGNTGTDFKANFNSGANYTKKDNKTCVLKSEVYFQCNRNMKWKPVDAGKTAFLPANYITNVTFNESNCTFTVYVQYEGACTAIAPPQPIPEDNSLSLGSILIIMRPSGDPVKDSVAHTMPIKLKHKMKLEKMVTELESVNKMLKDAHEKKQKKLIKTKQKIDKISDKWSKAVEDIQNADMKDIDLYLDNHQDDL